MQTLNRFNQKSKDRETAEKFFVFKKDGYMVSKPYQNEMQISQSTNVFDKLRLSSEDGDPTSEEMVGSDIAKFVGSSKE